MSKKFVFALALSLVFVSGVFFKVQADCGRLPCLNMPSCFSGCNSTQEMGRDKAGKDTNQGTEGTNNQQSSVTDYGKFKYWPIN